jgi:hypothetical protein
MLWCGVLANTASDCAEKVNPMHHEGRQDKANIAGSRILQDITGPFKKYGGGKDVLAG